MKIDSNVIATVMQTSGRKYMYVTEMCIISFYSRIGYYVSSFQSIFTAEGVFHREAAKVIQNSFQNNPSQQVSSPSLPSHNYFWCKVPQ